MWRNSGNHSKHHIGEKAKTSERHFVPRPDFSKSVSRAKNTYSSFYTGEQIFVLETGSTTGLKVLMMVEKCTHGLKTKKKIPYEDSE